MKKQNKSNFYIALGLFAAFLLWTAVICLVDVRAIGPRGSTVGFAALNRFFHGLTGVHMPLYVITDWLSLIPLGCACGFTMLGLVQWAKRKNLLKVDRSLLFLGGFYLVVMAAYVLFEFVVVNYRPVLIEGVLEASYPSSTTMLTLTVMPTAMIQINPRLKRPALRRTAFWSILVFTAFMVIGRLVSGVHWLTDIIGGILLSASLVMAYVSALR